jgi:hypothetical protein
MPGFSNDSLNSPYAIQILDDSLAFEYVQDFSGGEDDFRRATLIAANQCQHLLNVMVRDNYEARTRPGADAIPTAATLPVANCQGVFALRYFQTLNSGTPIEQLMAAVNVGGVGHILKFDSTNAWTDLTASLPAGFPSAADDRIAMAVGVNTLLMSDGVNQGVIWDGTNFTQTGAAGNTNFPIGATILCYFQGCMFASGVGTAQDTLYISFSLAGFAATNWNLTVRSFRVGAGDGDPIVAIAPMQASTLAILKQNSVWLLTYSPAADTGGATAASAFSAAKVVTVGKGCVGRDAWCAVGNDILFMSQDGVRSVQRMQAAAGQWQLTSPISQPVQQYIEQINQAAWSGIVAANYQEFAFFFVPLGNSLVNNFCLVYNTRLQTWMGAWQGSGTNWQASCVELTRFQGTQHLVFGDVAGFVNQWKDLSSNTDDGTYLDNGLGYGTQVWTRSFQFQEAINNKTAYNTVVRFTSGNSAIAMGWVADLQSVKNWTGSTNITGDILGIGTLPFLLESTAPVKITKGIRGLPAFNEAYITIQSTSGWFWLKNIVASAFINAYKETS